MLPAIFLAAILLIFSGVGIALWAWAIRDLLDKRRHLKHAERYESTILGVEQRTIAVREKSRTRYQYRNYPVIQFTRASGEQVTFTSETGDTGKESKYAEGQKIRVVYDPDRVLPPMIDNRIDIYYLPITLAAAGTVTLGVVILMAVLFIPRVMSQL